MSNILFYSKKCQSCDKIINDMTQLELSKYFVMFNIDEDIHSVSKYVKYVPTLIMENIDRPLVKNEVFEWINLFKEFKLKNKYCTNVGLLVKNINSQVSFSDSFNSNILYAGIEGDKHDKDIGLVSCNKITLNKIIANKENTKIKKEDMSKIIINEMNKRRDDERELKSQQMEYIKMAKTYQK